MHVCRVTHFVFHEEHVCNVAQTDQFKIPKVVIEQNHGLYRNISKKDIELYGKSVIYLFRGQKLQV